MNILFLSLYDYSKNTRDIYADLLSEMRDLGHSISIVCPMERRQKKSTVLETINDMDVLKLKMLNIRKVNKIEKGLATLSIESIFKNGIKKYFSDRKFDLVIYTTPPITFSSVVKYIKERDNAKSYLLLKDIFPQNAVDLEMMKENGLLYKFFRKKEKELYQAADYIGCMSEKNIEFLLRHNNDIDSDKVEISPNSIIPNEYKILSIEEKESIREKYNLPKDKLIVAYGGNLGEPQGIGFLINAIKQFKEKEVFFFIAGNGTEYSKIEECIVSNNLKNIKLVQQLPKEAYDKVLKSCDIGLIMLDKRFTIPNIPSRILSYMDFGMPVISAVDENTDIGEIIENGKFGYSCINGDLIKFEEIIDKFVNNKELASKLGLNSRKYLEKNYTAKHSANIILKHFN